MVYTIYQPWLTEPRFPSNKVHPFKKSHWKRMRKIHRKDCIYYKRFDIFIFLYILKTYRQENLYDNCFNNKSI